MHYLLKAASAALFGSILQIIPLFATDVMVRSPSGENYVIEVYPEERFLDVVERIGSCFASDSLDRIPYEREIGLDFMVADLNNLNLGKKSKKIVRDYYAGATEKEKEIIHYIIYTLGNKSLPYIVKESFSLKKSGDKIDSVHPFRFLEVIFTDEKLKASMPNIRQGSWVWNGFKDGLFTSLTEEQKKKNLIEFVNDFSRNVGVNPMIIQPSIQNGKWEELVDLLITHVPREGDPGRYNM